jgi:hypothetical protein
MSLIRTPTWACRAPRLPVAEIVLAVTVIAGGIWLYRQSSGLSFYGDDWGLVFARQGLRPSTLLAPFNGTLDLAQILIYKVLLATFGLSSYSPFRVVVVALDGCCAVLLFVLARRRVGTWGALLAAALVMFLGSAGEILVYPGAMNHLAAVAAGLGMLVALDLRTSRGDLVACLLLLVSVAAGGEGVAFAVAALAQILLAGDLRSRWWVPVIPLAFILGWELKYGRQGSNGLTLSNARPAPHYIADLNGRTVAALVGLNRGTWGAPLAVATAGVLLARIAVIRRISPQLAGAICGWLSFWTLTALARANLGLAVTGRYLYPGAIFVLLIAIEAFRGCHLQAKLAVPAGAIVIAAAVSNAHALRVTHGILKSGSDLVRTDLAAVDLAGDRLPATYPIPAAAWGMNAEQYRAVAGKWGSPAFRAQQLPSLSEELRLDADTVLGVGLGLQRNVSPRIGGTTPRLVGAIGGQVHDQAPACLLFAPLMSGAMVDVTLPPSGLAVLAEPGPVSSVQVRRFASTYSASLGGVPAGASAVLAIPRDGSPQPWQVRVAPRGRVRLCTVTPGISRR